MKTLARTMAVLVVVAFGLIFVSVAKAVEFPTSSDIVSADSQEKMDGVSLSWDATLNSFTVSFGGLDYKDIVDFTWNGRIVTDAVNKMMSEGQASIMETAQGFTFSVKNADYNEDGNFGVMLASGEVIEISVPALPVPSEKMCSPEERHSKLSRSQQAISPLTATSSCGGFSDSSDPYPCCTNGSRPDGNCTWYAWYRAHQSYHGWGQKLPAWGNAISWCANALKSGYTVSSTPRGSAQGYSIGCHSSGAGHVAWVWNYDSNYVWVDEQNCCDCSVAGTRIGAKYPRSYFKYIYKK